MKTIRLIASLLLLMALALSTNINTAHISPPWISIKFPAHFLAVALLYFVLARMLSKRGGILRSIHCHGLDYASLGLTLTLVSYIFLKSKLMDQTQFADQIGVAFATFHFWLISIFTSRWVSSVPDRPISEQRASLALAGVMALGFLVDLVLL